MPSNIAAATGSFSPLRWSWYGNLLYQLLASVGLLIIFLGPDWYSPALRNRPPGYDAKSPRAKSPPRAALPVARHQRPAELPRALQARLRYPPRCVDSSVRVRRVPEGPRESRPGPTQSYDGPQCHGGHDGRYEGADGHDHSKYDDYELDQCLFQWLCDQYVFPGVMQVGL